MIYYIGLIFALILFFISIDDLVWDIYYLLNKIVGNLKDKSISFHDVENEKPKMIAILVAAYNEENVLKEVIRNMVVSSHYPNSMYHIFLGVYPNDPGTQKVADELVNEFDNVHKVVHTLDGPSSKADNLNNIIKNLENFERKNHLEFSAIVIHDSEDIVHPYEFKLENFLLEDHKAIQMPVFPLHEKTNIRNFKKNLISGTYADEFAENHYRLLVARNATGAFVPSAGTGFVIRRDVLDIYEDSNVFPVGSLTEDYKLSLELKKKGVDVHYVLENVEKLLPNGKVAREFVSIRSMFPSNYSAAVKQKTRWIYGITMQSFSLRDIVNNKNLNFQSKYSLYRDWKAKIGNLLLGPGYLMFVYFILSLFINLPTIYPRESTSWYLMLFLSIVMLERQILRFVAVKKVYGVKSAIGSILAPPILPLKMLVGNIINFHATLKAWLTNLSIERKDKPKKIKWSKTDHQFLEEQVLKGFRRNLGDKLLAKKVLTKKELSNYIKLSKKDGVNLSDYLIKHKIVDEDIIVESICEVERKKYVKMSKVKYLNTYMRAYGKEELRKIKAIPIIKLNGVMYVITSLDSDKDLIEKVLNEYSIEYIYTSEKQLLNSITDYNSDIASDNIKKLEEYLKKGYIDVEQALIALSYSNKNDNIDDILNEMGLLKNI